MNINMLINLATLIALISFIALAILAIKSLSKFNFFLDDFKEFTRRAESDIKEMKEKSILTMNNYNELKPKIEEALDDLKDLKSKSIESLQHSDDTMDSAKLALDNFNRKIDKVDAIILPFEMLAKSFYNKVAEPVNNTGKVVSAVFKAANVFASKFRK